MKLFIAAKAFIEHDGKILLLRCSPREGIVGDSIGHYETPGGRLEPGEHLDETLKREVREETGLDVEIGTPFATGEWRPTIHGEQCQVIAVFFRCKAKSAAVQLSNEHDDYKWIDPKEHLKYPIAKNIVHVFEEYLKVSSGLGKP